MVAEKRTPFFSLAFCKPHMQKTQKQILSFLWSMRTVLCNSKHACKPHMQTAQKQVLVL